MSPQVTRTTPTRAAGIAARTACLLAVTIAALTTATVVPASVAASAENARTTLRVKGMYCGGCEATVRSVLVGLDGVSRAAADSNTQTATVTYDPVRITAPQMVRAVNTNTYYRASISNRSATDAANAPAQTDGGIGVWAGAAALGVAVAASAVVIRRARRGAGIDSRSYPDAGS